MNYIHTFSAIAHNSTDDVSPAFSYVSYQRSRELMPLSCVFDDLDREGAERYVTTTIARCSNYITLKSCGDDTMPKAVETRWHCEED